ncbi:MAG TPA: hypothetical protein VEI02_08955 [Planctomycetota bacterium]|nr:hypothetical protein [Planctomycetota bacterium]
MTIFVRALALIAGLGAAAAAQAPASRPAGYVQIDRGATGALAVRVRYDGEAPASRPIVLSPGFRRRAPEDAAYCDGCLGEGVLYDESLLVDPATKGVADVAVAFRKVERGRRPPLAPASIDNAKCRFAPHVLFAPVDAALRVKNSDPVGHAAALSDVVGAMLTNVVVPPGATVETPKLVAPGLFVVTCPLHDWMKGYVVASRHPYVGVTGRDGRTAIDLAPPGRHGVTFWHETLGAASRTVEIEADQVATLELTSADFRKPR